VIVALVTAIHADRPRKNMPKEATIHPARETSWQGCGVDARDERRHDGVLDLIWRPKGVGRAAETAAWERSAYLSAPIR
jgi:hypothetical protein